MYYVNRLKIQDTKYKPSPRAQAEGIQDGVSLYITLVILSLLLAIALAGSSLLIGQLGRLKSSGNSVLAFYAADAGIERALYLDNKNCSLSSSVAERITCVQTGIAGLILSDTTLANNATFELSITPGGSGSCPAGKNYCVKSKGVFKDATRVLRISR
ncbi:MAG: hypothetical protein Greene071421_466 [Parcubacteria group bacterium Greene0714_21]|nr:MAG: hypothetical protein Greene041639_119 [Parcubacteria group bacterium Greene0416_39]TSC97444.1 MAG: hypothetical protein Greene101447_488 [Parcubacteria group bacterium Greene1014_47]TSD04100.1 MAG: hypothetical protein Greene071421_466 [Parcubacteria group bacterium Greene0714_21]